MRKDKTTLKTELLTKYSEALDELLKECETKEDFRELEEAVEKLAAKALPETLKQVVESKDFFPKVS
jgi:vacuolar-type H+-ATPase subunit E/Vma4